jgi:hypothetical protein
MDRAGNLDHQSAHCDDATEYFDTVDIADLFSESFHGAETVFPGCRPACNFRRLINHPLGLLPEWFH